MSAASLGLLEYVLVIGLVLVFAILELASLLRIQKRDRRMRNGSSERTHED